MTTEPEQAMDIPIDRPLSPDCWSHKHRACHGDAWSAEEDRVCDCSCECHRTPSRPASSVADLNDEMVKLTADVAREDRVSQVATELLDMLIGEAESSASDSEGVSLGAINIDRAGWSEVVRVALEGHGFLPAASIKQTDADRG